MSASDQIRAHFDRDTIVMYQAYAAAIAAPAVTRQTFVSPFSFQRMTWIKPSFGWLMHRSNWARKPGQDHILAVRITRTGWEQALDLGVLTSYVPALHGSHDAWRQAFATAPVHIQWDTERSPRGGTRCLNSIQVGLSRHIIREFVDRWIVSIEDLTPLVHKLKAARHGNIRTFNRLLPPEAVYPLSPALQQRLIAP